MSTMIKKTLLSLLVLAATFNLIAQQSGSFKDPRDSKVYKTVKIGSQLWMAENLNVSRFRNGDFIPEVKSTEEWQNACKNKQPAWCYYNNIELNGIRYGKLYNWYAVNDPRELAPAGWRVASEKDWNILLAEVGGPNLAGKKLKNDNYWALDCNKDNNSIGFAINPGNTRDLEGGFYIEYFSGRGTKYWTSTFIENAERFESKNDNSSNNVYCPVAKTIEINCSDIITISGLFADFGFYVRCVKND